MKRKQTLESYLLAVVRGETTGLTDRLVLWGLGGLEVLYFSVLQLKQLLTRQHGLPRPVISVGNLAVGGTGKTPTVVWLARQLQAAGLRPAILTRGYGGKLQEAGKLFSSCDLTGLTGAETGDEPYLLAKLLPGCWVAVGRDRVRMGLQALEAEPAIDLFILDDGFQYWKLKRDLDLVLLDATRPFDNRHLLPRGLLREPLAALRRAQVILVTRAERVDPSVLEQTQREIRHYNPTAAVALVQTVNSEVTPLEQWGSAYPGSLPAAEFLNRRRIGLVTAIGNPVQVQSALEALGAELARVQVFPDHHVWNEAELTMVLATMRGAAVRDVVVTAKDAVKLLPYLELFRNNQVECHILSLDFTVTDPSVTAQILKVARQKGGAS